MLIQSRKFDIRCWVLITQDMDCFLFEQGYVRLSSHRYNLQSSDPAVHLTNHAIQVQDPAYGRKEAGNQLSFAQCLELTGVDIKKIMLTKARGII